MIAVSHLVKRYGAHTAVDDVSFEVERGQVCGFLGPNGAGKSTTLRIIAGFLGSTSGKVTVCGYDIAREPRAAKRNLGYMPEAVPLYPEMRVFEYLAFRCELKGLPRREHGARIDEAMQKAQVTDVANVLIGHLSKGYRQRVGLADALVARPPLLVLDEPTAGLDPNQIREVRDVLRGLGSDHTVLVSTHILSEVEATCSRVVVIAKGQVVAQGTIDEVLALRRSKALDLVVRGDPEKARELVSTVSEVASTKCSVADSTEADLGPTFQLRCRWVRGTSPRDVNDATERVVARLVAAGFAVREVRPASSSLEDVFAELTRAPSPSGEREGTDVERQPRDEP